MSKGTVCLTFDFDAMSLWIVRGLLSPGPISRGEFGAHAIPRILDLLEREHIPSTFFVPGHTVETYPGECRAIIAAGHEIGLHGYAHELVSSLTPEQERDVCRRGYEAIASVAGTPPRGNRTPSWDFTPSTIEILLELGLRYDSSLMSTDYAPFFSRAGDVVTPDAPATFGTPTDLVQLPVSWSLDDYPAFEYFRSNSYVMPGLRTPDDVFGNFLDDLRYMVRDYEDGVCTITFHPQVIGRGHRLLGLERFIEQVRGLDLEFARLDTVADQFRGGRNYGVHRPRGGAA